MVGFCARWRSRPRRSGVTVNAVCPGYTDTDLVSDGIDSIVAKTGRTREQALAELAEAQAAEAG